MADREWFNRMPAVVVRGLPPERELLSVPLHRDLGIFVDHWAFPRVVGRVLADGSVRYDCQATATEASEQ